MNCWLDFRETGMRPAERREEGVVIHLPMEDEECEDDREADGDFSPFFIHGSGDPRQRIPLRRCTRSHREDPALDETIFESAIEKILSGKRNHSGSLIDYF